MCIAYLAVNAHPDWPLFIAANRDEYHERPARPLAPWHDSPWVIAGRDDQEGGTWLGITCCGKVALLTNYRDPASHQPQAPSRGHLVSRFLQERESDPEDYLQALAPDAPRYNGFNLVVGQVQTHHAQLAFLANRGPDPKPQTLAAGRHVLSNHLMNTPWPKAERLRRRLDAMPLENLADTLEASLEALRDTTRAHDNDLPDTGLDKARESLLSSPFIVSPAYGTRCSTIVAIHRSGRACISETSYTPEGKVLARHDWPFALETPDTADALVNGAVGWNGREPA